MKLRSFFIYLQNNTNCFCIRLKDVSSTLGIDFLILGLNHTQPSLPALLSAYLSAPFPCKILNSFSVNLLYMFIEHVWLMHTHFSLFICPMYQ